MNSNSFSVVMPTYDRDDLYLLFDEAIKSCLSNTVLPDEIIVIVDGPVRPSFVSKIQSFEKLDCVKVIWLPEMLALHKL